MVQGAAAVERQRRRPRRHRRSGRKPRLGIYSPLVRCARHAGIARNGACVNPADIIGYPGEFSAENQYRSPTRKRGMCVNLQGKPIPRLRVGLRYAKRVARTLRMASNRPSASYREYPQGGPQFLVTDCPAGRYLLGSMLAKRKSYARSRYATAVGACGPGSL